MQKPEVFLLQYIVGVALLGGYEKISLEADASNARLVDWYRKFSFEVVEFLEDYYGNILAMTRKGYSERAIIRKFPSGQDRLVKWVTLGNASFANMVRSALRSAQD